MINNPGESRCVWDVYKFACLGSFWKGTKISNEVFFIVYSGVISYVVIRIGNDFCLSSIRVLHKYVYHDAGASDQQFWMNHSTKVVSLPKPESVPTEPDPEGGHLAFV